MNDDLYFLFVKNNYENIKAFHFHIMITTLKQEGSGSNYFYFKSVQSVQKEALN